MDDAIFVAALSMIGTLGGTLGGIVASSKKTNFRLEQLEKKVEKHNNLIERTFRIEKAVEDLERKVYHAN